MAADELVDLIWTALDYDNPPAGLATANDVAAAMRANPDVVLRALGGTECPTCRTFHDGGVWSFPKSAHLHNEGRPCDCDECETELARD